MPETSAIKALTRRVKNKALEIAEEILNNPDKHTPELYNQTFLTVLKNAVPRAQEIAGEDGDQLKINVIQFGHHDSIQLPTTSLPTGIPTSSTEIQDSSPSQTSGQE